MANVLDFQVNGLSPSKVGGAGTSVKYFPRLLGPSIGVAPTTPSSTSAAGALLLPAGGVYNGQQFEVIAGGNFGSDTGDPSGTVTVQLYAVTGTASVPVYTSIATTGAMTPSVTIQPWGLQATLVGSNLTSGSALGILVGKYEAFKYGSVTSPTTITAAITGLDFFAGNPNLAQGAVLGFVVGVTFGTTDATNAAQLTEFTIES